jgi:uncharacterized protein (DUF427 family)
MDIGRRLLGGLGATLGSRKDDDAGSAPHARMRASWKGVTIAESDRTILVEGNHYFPPDSVDRRFLQPSATHTKCPWKGQASYHSVVVGEDVNRDAAWYYPSPKPAAAQIRDYVAFWRGVTVKPRPVEDAA